MSGWAAAIKGGGGGGESGSTGICLHLCAEKALGGNQMNKYLLFVHTVKAVVAGRAFAAFNSSFVPGRNGTQPCQRVGPLRGNAVTRTRSALHPQLLGLLASPSTLHILACMWSS